MADIISADELERRGHYLIVDVRQPYEVMADPVENALNIPLPELLARLDELPQDKLLAFVCAGNVRSAQAADYLSGALGWSNVCVLDKFSL